MRLFNSPKVLPLQPTADRAASEEMPLLVIYLTITGVDYRTTDVLKPHSVATQAAVIKPTKNLNSVSNQKEVI